MKSDKSTTKSGIVGRYLTVLDLKTSCRALSASMRWTKAICWLSRVPQPMRNCHESHVNKHLFKHGGDRLDPKTKRGLSRQNLLVCGKRMSRQILARFDPDKNLQFYDKKSASVRQPYNGTYRIFSYHLHKALTKMFLRVRCN